MKRLLFFLLLIGNAYGQIGGGGGGGGSGTVTSISGSGGTTGLTLTGGPITTTGTLTLGGTLAIADGGTGNTTALLAIEALTAKGADIASASTTDLSTATGPYLNVTGTATITSFGTVAAGTRFGLKFTGASQITYNGTSMILLSGASVTNANGTTRVFESLGSGNWQEVINNLGGAPGGSTTQVQYNNAGAFGGSSGETSNGTVQTLTTPVLTGLPTGTGVASAGTASTLAARDANANLTSNNFLFNYRTTATAAGTTTLVVGDAYYQYFTGTTTQNVTMPVASTLALGQAWDITNLSTGVVTVNTSAGGGNAIVILPANTETILTCILTSGTTAASWHVNYGGITVPSGASIIVSGPTVARTWTVPDASFSLARIDAAQTFTGVSGTTSWNMTNPVIIGGLTASGSGANDFSGSSGTFKTSTGAVTLGNGAISVSGIETFSAAPVFASVVPTATGTGGLDLSGGSGIFKTSTGVNTHGGPTVLVTGTSSITPLNIPAGTNRTTPAAGDVENDGVELYYTPETTASRTAVENDQYFHLTANGGAITSIANFFGATSNPTLVANAYYELDVVFFYVTTGTGADTFTFTNSSAPTSQNIDWQMSPTTGVVAPPGTATMLEGEILNDATAARTIVTASLSAATHYAHVRFWIKNGSGTSLKIQATSGGTNLTPQIGSCWHLRRLSPNNIGVFVN